MWLFLASLVWGICFRGGLFGRDGVWSFPIIMLHAETEMFVAFRTRIGGSSGLPVDSIMATWYPTWSQSNAIFTGTSHRRLSLTPTSLVTGSCHSLLPDHFTEVSPTPGILAAISSTTIFPNTFVPLGRRCDLSFSCGPNVFISPSPIELRYVMLPVLKSIKM